MSRGIGGNCRIVEEDEHTVIYEYGGYNLNEPEYRNFDCITQDRNDKKYSNKCCITVKKWIRFC